MHSGTYRLILHQCAQTYITTESWQMLELFLLFRDFHQLPFPGTILDQPAAMIDAWRIFSYELSFIRGSDRPVTGWEISEILYAYMGGKKR